MIDVSDKNLRINACLKVLGQFNSDMADVVELYFSDESIVAELEEYLLDVSLDGGDDEEILKHLTKFDIDGLKAFVEAREDLTEMTGKEYGCVFISESIPTITYVQYRKAWRLKVAGIDKVRYLVSMVDEDKYALKPLNHIDVFIAGILNFDLNSTYESLDEVLQAADKIESHRMSLSDLLENERSFGPSNKLVNW